MLFRSMYNHVSQVIYFHKPQYERTPRVDLTEMLESCDPMQLLPAIRQIHPEIEILYEECSIDLSAPCDKWYWIVLPRRVYLVSPSSKVYFSNNILALLSVYAQSGACSAT